MGNRAENRIENGGKGATERGATEKGATEKGATEKDATERGVANALSCGELVPQFFWCGLSWAHG